jgi:hypothetical protein
MQKSNLNISKNNFKSKHNNNITFNDHNIISDNYDDEIADKALKILDLLEKHAIN